jgi:hypothetical protein
MKTTARHGNRADIDKECEMSNAIVLSDWNTMKEQAGALVRSGLLPSAINTPEKAIVIMMQGRELGIGPMQALNGINVIAGKATISPQLMLALIENSGKLEDIAIETSPTSSTVTMKRIGRTPHSETFSIEDARAMGIAQKDNYKKQPATMLKWRAVAACSRVVFPDVICGMYTHEEINPDFVDVETGEIIAAQSEGVEVAEVSEHWTVSQNWKTFYVYCTKNLGLTRDEVHDALEVDSAKKFSGTKEEAFKALKDYAAAKAEAASTATETEETHGGHIDLEEFFASNDAPDSGQNAVDAISR